MNTYGDFFKEKTPAELAKQCSIINVMRERERCAKIAEEMTCVYEGPRIRIEGFRLACEAIAAAIRAQAEDWTTLGEIMDKQLL